MFYQSPFASPTAAQQIPPAFNEVTQALRQATAGNSFLYMAETKKLCLAVCAAEEVASELKSRNQTFDAIKLFQQELQNQILAFALMRVLPDDVVKAAMQSVSAPNDAAGVSSAASRLARELEQAAGESEETVKAVQEALMDQPLFRLASQMPEVFVNLAQQYEQCSPYAAQLMRTLKSSMGMLVTSAANAAAAAAPAVTEAQAKAGGTSISEAAAEAQKAPRAEPEGGTDKA